MNRRPPSETRSLIARLGVLVIVVALSVALFQVANDLRANKRSNARQLANDAQLRELLARADTNLGDLLRRQSALLAALPSDVDAATAAARDDLAEATSRLLAAPRTTVPDVIVRPSAPGPTVVVTAPPAPSSRVVSQQPAARTPRPAATSTPTPSPTRACQFVVLRVCLSGPGRSNGVR